MTLRTNVYVKLYENLGKVTKNCVCYVKTENF